MTTTAELAVERSEPDHLHIDMSGEIDMANAASIEHQLDDLVATAATATIDLSGLTFIDSHGVNVLAHLIGRHLENDFTLVLIAPPTTPAHDLLAITGLTTVVPVLEARPPTSSASTIEGDTGG